MGHGITPILSENEMYMLEKSIRTLHLSKLPKNAEVYEQDYRKYFEKFGEVESINFLCKPEYTNGYGFIFFKGHLGRSRFRESELTTALISGHIISIQDSKTSSKTMKRAQTSGLLDWERKPTPIFFTCLSVALENARKLQEQRTIENHFIHSPYIVMQNPQTRAIYTMTTGQYQNYIAQQNQQWFYQVSSQRVQAHRTGHPITLASQSKQVQTSQICYSRTPTYTPQRKQMSSLRTSTCKANQAETSATATILGSLTKSMTNSRASNSRNKRSARNSKVFSPY